MVAVKENIKKHDQFSFEAKFMFARKEQAAKVSSYNVDMYLFLPHGLDVNKHNFSNRDFYNSLKTIVRLTTPFYKLDSIIVGYNNPFKILQNSISSLVTSSKHKYFLEYEKQTKLFCSILKVALRNESELVLKKNVEKRSSLILQYSKNVKAIREAFKLLSTDFNDIKRKTEAINIYRYADEYQSLLVEKSTSSLIKSLNKKSKLSDKESDTLNDLILSEMDYRLKVDYPSVVTNNNSRNGILHRNARLKKFIESNLYLNTDTKKEGVIVEQVLFSIAAGIAMVFATGVAFASQIIYGNLSMPFFVALVIGYMFKDRIKELVRVFFSKKHQKLFYDFKTKIYNQQQQKIGALKESFNFEKHIHLPKKILDARNKIRATEITENSLGEKIIHYRTKIEINNKVKLSNSFVGITQMLRFNISDLVRKMDDPKKEILIRTKNGFNRSFSDRVYHINLILTFSDKKKYTIVPYKIYANRKGIKKIKNV